MAAQASADDAVPAAAYRPGIYSDGMIETLLAEGAIRPAIPLVDGQIQPASLDLRLGRRAWRIRASFLPGANGSVAERIAHYGSMRST